MAKKSAKSKGYRRQSAKKPYLSKRDIALLCALIVAIAVGAFFLFRYDDGAVKVQDGAVVTEANHNGGALGGLTTGMPLRFRTVIKPTPTIARPRRTVDLRTGENVTVTVSV